MSFQAYLDKAEELTGKTPQEFVDMAREKNLTQHKEILAWLNSDYGPVSYTHLDVYKRQVHSDAAADQELPLARQLLAQRLDNGHVRVVLHPDE